MKFSPRTIQILRNFSTINQSIIFKPGNQIKTISSSKTIMARATIDTDIDQTFAIWDLSQFLSAISLFDNPELIPHAKHMEISNGSEKLRYQYAEPSLIQAAPEKEIVLPSAEINFELKNDVLSRVQKALGIIDAPEIAVSGDGVNIYVEALNTKNSSDSTYKVEVGVTDKKFQLIFLAENVKLLPNDYQVSISSKGLGHFKTDDVEYWVAVEQHSTYQG